MQQVKIGLKKQYHVLIFESKKVTVMESVL